MKTPTQHFLQLRPQGAYAQIDDLLRLRFSARDLLLSAKRPATSLLAGGKRTRFRGRGIDFEEVRLYQAGDDIRSIDWRVTARTQVTHTKLFSEERERPIFIACDLRSPMFFGTKQCFKSVLASHLATSLGWAALAGSDRVGGLVFGDRDHRDIRPKRSKHALLEFIHQLHSYGNKLDKPFASLSTNSLLNILQNSRRHAKPGSAVFIISDFHDFNNDCERQLFQLSRHSDVTLFHIADPMEKSLPAACDMNVTDGISKRALGTLDTRFAKQYSESVGAHAQHLQRSCQKLGITLAGFSTDGDPQAQLQELYGRSRSHSSTQVQSTT